MQRRRESFPGCLRSELSKQRTPVTATVNQAAIFDNATPYSVDHLILEFCKKYSHETFEEKVDRIGVESSMFKPRNVLETLLSHAVVQHGADSILDSYYRMTEAPAGVTLCDVNAVQDEAMREKIVGKCRTAALCIILTPNSQRWQSPAPCWWHTARTCICQSQSSLAHLDAQLCKPPQGFQALPSPTPPLRRS
jgi:hypothetical protein